MQVVPFLCKQVNFFSMVDCTDSFAFAFGQKICALLRDVASDFMFSF